MKRTITLVSLLLLTLGCSGAHTGTTIPTDTTTFGLATPSADAAERYTAAAAYSEARSGRALLVIRGTDIVFERYAEGVDPELSTQLYSGTKPFSCGLAGIGVRDGWLALDDKVIDSLPELQASPDLTVEQLLTFTSGVRDDRSSMTLDAFRDEPRVDDKLAVAVSQPQEHPPGTTFAYDSVHQWLFTGVVQAQTGAPALATLESEIFEPIGLRHGGWMSDAEGHTALPYGAFTTAREWAKYGVLLRDGGVWQGTQVLPEGWVERCTTGTDANPAFGLATWLNKPLDGADVLPIRGLPSEGPILGERVPEDVFAAAGAKDQRMYMIPSEDLVIVRLSDGGGGFNDADFLELLLP